MIIAEVGINHMGNMDLARQMIYMAKQSGGDICKFQLYDTKKLARTPEQTKVLGEAELSFEQARDLFNYGNTIGMEVFFSVFDVERVGWCEEIGVKRYKIARTMRDNDVIRAVCLTRKEWIMSKDYMQDVGLHHNERGLPKILYCDGNYPSNTEILPLIDFKDDVWDGLSDHYIGIDIAKIAIVRGANIIEKHFTLSHDMGADGLWSMTPDECSELARWGKLCHSMQF